MKLKSIGSSHSCPERLAAAIRKLKRETGLRRTAQLSLAQSKRHYGQLLAQSEQMHKQMQLLSRQILLAQEEERKQISRELHDEITQTLAGINVYLAALKTDAKVNTTVLNRNIARTQKLVEKSVDIVHRFARQLRPTVLDDLGLIPALHSFLKEFTRRTGILIQVTVAAGVETLNNTRRTVLFRVAQEALTNVDRHAQATHVKVSIRKLSDSISMEISDDGKSFQVERVMQSRDRKHLGLLGMRERIEMVGGNFNVESRPGKGTTVSAQIPLGKSSNPKS